MNKQGLQFTIGVILLTATTALAAVCNKLVQSVDDCDTLRCGTSSPSLENDCHLKIFVGPLNHITLGAGNYYIGTTFQVPTSCLLNLYLIEYDDDL